MAINRYFIHVVTPIFLGGLLYIFCRSNILFLEWIPYISQFPSLNTPQWVKYNLPDGLWFYSFLSAIIFIWKKKFSQGFFVWLFSIITLCVLSELFQMYNFLPGTFDWNDLLAYFIAAAFCILLSPYIKRYLLFHFKSFAFSQKKFHSLIVVIFALCNKLQGQTNECNLTSIPDEISAVVKNCSHLYLEGRYLECISEYDDLLKQHPDYCVGYYNRGLCKYYSEDKEGARKDFEKAISFGMNEPKQIILKLYPATENTIIKTETNLGKFQNRFFQVLAIALTFFAIYDFVH